MSGYETKKARSVISTKRARVQERRTSNPCRPCRPSSCRSFASFDSLRECSTESIQSCPTRASGSHPVGRTPNRSSSSRPAGRLAFLVGIARSTANGPIFGTDQRPQLLDVFPQERHDLSRAVFVDAMWGNVPSGNVIVKWIGHYSNQFCGSGYTQFIAVAQVKFSGFRWIGLLCGFAWLRDFRGLHGTGFFLGHGSLVFLASNAVGCPRAAGAGNAIFAECIAKLFDVFQAVERHGTLAHLDYSDRRNAALASVIAEARRRDSDQLGCFLGLYQPTADGCFLGFLGFVGSPSIHLRASLRLRSNCAAVLDAVRPDYCRSTPFVNVNESRRASRRASQGRAAAGRAAGDDRPSYRPELPTTPPDAPGLLAERLYATPGRSWPLPSLV